MFTSPCLSEESYTISLEERALMVI